MNWVYTSGIDVAAFNYGPYVIPDTWTDAPVPFGSYIPARGGEPARIVVFRRPVELRAATRAERTALVNEVLVEYYAELLGRDPSEIDP